MKGCRLYTFCVPLYRHKKKIENTVTCTKKNLLHTPSALLYYTSYCVFKYRGLFCYGVYCMYNNDFNDVEKK